MSDSRPHPHRRIRAQASPRDQAVMRFILDAPVQEGRAQSFEAAIEGVPLATALFAMEGIRKVQVTGETIIVSLTPGHDWAGHKREVAAAIRQVLDSFELPLGDAREPSGAEQDASLLASVNDVLDNQANPSIARHGGRVTAERVVGGIVYLRMSGGCQGCAASSLTLRGGIERILRAAVPGIREIVDVTDHSAGANPFYQNMPGAEGAISPLGTSDLGTSNPDGEESEAPVKGQADGMQPASAMTATRLADRIRRHLEALTRAEVPITYGELARALGMYRPGSIRLVTDALELMMHQDATAGRPFMAARVASRGSGDLPGRGYFDLAAALGRGPEPSESREAFHRRELDATFEQQEHAASAEGAS